MCPKSIRRILAAIVVVIFGFGPSTALAVSALSKEAMHARMVELASSMAALKQQIAVDRANQALKSQFDAARSEYDAISTAMGGDRARPTVAGVPAAGRATAARKALGGPTAGVIPPAPSGCTATTTTFTNSTPTAIPDNNPTGVSPTVSVTGVGPSLWDINVTLNITHTFNADLDITLTSPSGTVVTLTTDNGGPNDNVFAGTTFDDQADLGSQIPYVSPPNQVVDHVYTNLVVATPLTPEEPLGAFTGENPNGTWTLKVVDDLGGDVGTINSWSLEVTTLAAVPTSTPNTFTNSTPTAIPDNNPTGASSTIVVSAIGTSICDLNVTLDLPHTFAADLDITITSPSGTVVTLTTDNGGPNDNVFAGSTFDDSADPGSQIPYASPPNQAVDGTYTNLVVRATLTPEEPLAAFNGEDPNGTWTLKVVDDLGGDTGTINSWSLAIVTCACAPACVLTCPANITQSNDPNQCGAVVTYPAPTTTGSCGTVTCTPASGSFFPVGPTPVNCTATSGPTCNFTVTVNDTQAPSITCPPNVTQQLNPGETSRIVNYAAPVASDNCPGIVSVVCTPASGTSFSAGSTPVACTVTDAANNTAACGFSVNLTNPIAVPAVAPWGLLGLAALLAGAGFVFLRNRIS